MPRKQPARKARDLPVRQPAPITSLSAQARQQLVQADILSLEAGRARLSEATKGIFGTSRPLRTTGTTMANYMLGTTQRQKGVPGRPKKPRRAGSPAGSRRRPQARR